MPSGEVFVDIYADHGCTYAPSCLSCPYDVCRYDKGFAGNRVNKALSRVDRDARILEMRKSGMLVEEIATECGISGRTVARILARVGPSAADEQIVQEHDAETSQVARMRADAKRQRLTAMGVRQRRPLPKLRPGTSRQPRREVYSSGS